MNYAVFIYFFLECVFSSLQFGCAPVFYAARYNHLSVLKMLIECDAFINATTIMNRTALQIAAYHGHTDCVQYLIDMRANMNAVDDVREGNPVAASIYCININHLSCSVVGNECSALGC